MEQNSKFQFFEPDEDARTNAMFGGHWGEEWFRISDGYAKGALHLINTAVEDSQLDSLIYPVLFLFRHYIEFTVKEIYIMLMKLKDSNVDRAKIKGHSLVSKEFKDLVEFIENTSKERSWKWISEGDPRNHFEFG